MSVAAVVGALAQGLEAAFGIGQGIYSIVETERSKKRASAITKTRAFYDAIENRLGVTINQIDQFLDDLGFKNTRAIDLVRGTSRTGVARKIYSKVMTEYPGIRQEYINARNSLNNIVNNLMRQEEGRISGIEKSKGDLPIFGISKDVGEATNQANQIITSLSGQKNNGAEDSRNTPSTIDTSLTPTSVFDRWKERVNERNN